MLWLILAAAALAIVLVARTRRAERPVEPTPPPPPPRPRPPPSLRDYRPWRAHYVHDPRWSFTHGDLSVRVRVHPALIDAAIFRELADSDPTLAWIEAQRPGGPVTTFCARYDAMMQPTPFHLCAHEPTPDLLPILAIGTMTGEARAELWTPETLREDLVRHFERGEEA